MPWPNSAACRVAHHCPDRNAFDPSMNGFAGSEPGVGIFDARKDRHRHPEQRAKLLVPLLPVNVEQLRPRGVAGVRRVSCAAGQVKQKPGVDGSRAEVAAIRKGTGLRISLQEPADLGRGKQRIEAEPSLRLDCLLDRRSAERIDALRRPAALPGYARPDCLAGRTSPEEDGLALIGDSDRGDRCCVRERREATVNGGDRSAPDLVARLFDPARARIRNRSWHGMARDNTALRVQR